MICVKADYDLREVLATHERNIFWMCDDCADLFSRDHFRQLTAGCNINETPDADSITSIKDDIAGLKQAFGELSAKVECNPRTTTLSTPWQSIGRNERTLPNTPKRPRLDNKPATKPPILRGTKTASEIVKTIPPPEELLWIYLSAFDPSTSDNDIANLTRECLGLDSNVDPKVVKLVPKDRDLTTLSYVTFKVGVNKDLRETALASDTWPENVNFREFENYSKNQRPVVRFATGKPPSNTGGQ